MMLTIYRKGRRIAYLCVRVTHLYGTLIIALPVVIFE